jgi:Mn-containing catalase
MQETATQANPIVGGIMQGGERYRYVIEGMLHRHTSRQAWRRSQPTQMAFHSIARTFMPVVISPQTVLQRRSGGDRTYAGGQAKYSTSDRDMQDMLSFLIARDTMHQQQWLAVIEEMGPNAPSIPDSFNRNKEAVEFSHMFIGTEHNGVPIEPGRYCEWPSLDGTFSFREKCEPLGGSPNLGFARPDSAAQRAQMDVDPKTMSLT